MKTGFILLSFPNKKFILPSFLNKKFQSFASYYFDEWYYDEYQLMMKPCVISTSKQGLKLINLAIKAQLHKVWIADNLVFEVKDIHGRKTL